MNAGTDDDPWMRAGSAGRYLGVDRSTVRRWAEAGLLRGERTAGGPGRAGQWRFRRSELDRARRKWSSQVAS